MVHAGDQDIHWGRFVWDSKKESINIKKHGVDFKLAAHAFVDVQRIIIEDLEQ